MTRLRDLVHRSALRTRSAGDSEVGLPTGMGYHMFEITDQTIPAGTDWSSDGLVLGSLAFPEGAYALVDFWLEISEPLAGGDQLVIADATPGDVWNSAGFSVYLGYNGDGTPVRETLTKLIEIGNNGTLGSFAIGTIRHPGGPGFRGLTEKFICVGSNTPTHADITIARARASFLIL